jgi:hypothetical protein
MDLLNNRLGKDGSVVTCVVKFLLERVLRLLIEIYVKFIKRLSHLLVYIDQPISSLPRFGVSHRFFKDILLLHLKDLNIVVFTPLFLESIEDETVVVATVGITIMDAD